MTKLSKIRAVVEWWRKKDFTVPLREIEAILEEPEDTPEETYKIEITSPTAQSVDWYDERAMRELTKRDEGRKKGGSLSSPARCPDSCFGDCKVCGNTSSPAKNDLQKRVDDAVVKTFKEMAMEVSWEPTVCNCALHDAGFDPNCPKHGKKDPTPSKPLKKWRWCRVCGYPFPPGKKCTHCPGEPKKLPSEAIHQAVKKENWPQGKDENSSYIRHILDYLDSQEKR